MSFSRPSRYRPKGPWRVLRAAAVLSVLVLGGCGPSVVVHSFAPGPQNLYGARKLVLIAGSSEYVANRFLKEIRNDGVFEIAEAPRDGSIRLEDLGEGNLTEAANAFRVEWPADAYFSLSASYEKGYSPRPQSSRTDFDSGWVTCKLDVAIRDGQTGRLLAAFSTRGSEDWASAEPRNENTLLVKGRGGPSVDEASETAANEAIDDAVGQITPRRVSKRLSIEKSAAGAAAGIASIEAGDLRGARRLWKKTLQGSPNDAGLRYNLGAVSEALGNLQAAAAYYKEAARLAPANTRYQAAFQDLGGRLRDVRAIPAKSS